ncbi:hypothetical protein NDU88_006224 [Pleurodeles waltl]|uniref:Uncharacterized protein n=1 Tax=Pleurodeles waltl TaxID=8319 RepID=A0AAV7SP01_PLEWA|nr:hypothetical protein NDU88_006224 [Pleurodeles waltl]
MLQGKHDKTEDLRVRGRRKGEKAMQVQGDSNDWRRGEFGGTGEGGMESGPVHEEGADGRVPVCGKWPTMLVWSESDSEGEVGDGVEEASPPMQLVGFWPGSEQMHGVTAVYVSLEAGAGATVSLP